MKGVDYPVPGISDAGDKKMMYPEQEYTFKGKKVTEYPMAQKGRKVAPVYTDDPRKVRAYNDSLSLSNFSKLQHQLEPTLKNWMNPLASNKTQRNQGQFILEKAAQDLVNNNPNIDWDLGRYSGTGAKFIKNSSKNPNIKKGYVMDQYYPEIWKDEIVPEYVDNQSPDITHKTIKPTGHWWGKGQNNEYAAPVQPYILEPEPTLKRKVSMIEPISTQSSYTPSLRIPNIPNVELPSVERGKYRASYWDPEMKDWNERSFMSQQESDQFANEMSQRGYAGPYGNVTQRVQYKDGGSMYKKGGPVSKIRIKAYGGPMVRYMAGKMTGPNIF
jgi:hypothetical protein